MKYINKYFTLKRNKNNIGYLFVLPFIVGFLLFFVYPFFQTIIFSVNKLQITTTGYNLEYLGLENYKFAIFRHPKFNQIFVETIFETITYVPLILIFSFFAGVLLNQKFKGRTFARVIFFLPVIMGAGIILEMEASDYMSSAIQNTNIEQLGISLAGGEELESFLIYLNFPEVGINYIINAVNSIPSIIRASGVQILIFLAGLQSIPSSLYEASKVEGATAWEEFWKITFPMLSPIILTNLVYTVIDSFIRDNQMTNLIKETAFGGSGYGISVAMAVMYFIIIAIFLVFIVGIISRKVFYYYN